MTEAEWRDCFDVRRLLSHLTQEVTAPNRRKLRLFLCACCRRIWDHLGTRMQQIVESAELFAEGKLTRQQLATVRQEITGATSRLQKKHPSVAAAVWTVYEGDRSLLSWVRAGAEACGDAVSESARHVGAWAAERTAQAALLHDLFGNPFHSVAIDPAWLTWQDGLVPRMAEAISAERRFGEMPVLGDALEDAGCDNEDILSHCRCKGEHALGCWVLDRLLGRS
jgi:hypothetical protein